LHRNACSVADFAHHRHVVAVAERRIEIDDVQSLRAVGYELLGLCDRIVGVDLRGREVAAFHPHALAAAQIERGDNDHPRFSMGTKGPGDGPL
jgi:hypothetical protein